MSCRDCSKIDFQEEKKHKNECNQTCNSTIFNLSKTSLNKKNDKNKDPKTQTHTHTHTKQV